MAIRFITISAYDHRFLITGNWYFRAGVEYERYDFGGSDNGLPDHLQALYGHLALEYVVKDFPPESASSLILESTSKTTSVGMLSMFRGKRM